MVVKNTQGPVAATRAASTAADDPTDAMRSRIGEIVERFRAGAVTPQRFLELENEILAAATEACRCFLEREANRLEADDRREMPGRVRYRKETYRINKKTPARIVSRFGTIVLRSFYYLNEEDGEPGLHPLWLRLGIGAGAATPALLERVARMSVDHTQSEVRAWLRRDYGLVWSNTRLRKALTGFRQALLP